LTILSSDSKNNNSQLTQLNSENSPNLDLSIEGMRSQQFSEWVFVFLLVGILVFSAIVAAFLFGKKENSKFKPGERIMFAAIIIGLVVAVILGAMQMLGGYLF
jgi:glycerol uptake facilitator-like aquaporin